MAIFKCKMCGGTIEFEQGDLIGRCEYCGTKQTLPRLDNDRKANLYDRADHFRRNNEFDKAMEIYEHILHEDSTDAESYWSLVLCKFGIEYVEDPKTHKRIPTVNRAQLSSIYSDENYKNAIRYATPLQKELYETEAKAIDEIQKGILEISAKEKPFDIFICYKESDANGRRTKDSVYAQNIYKKLTDEGYRVFFSRITLEDKLGEAYEPYIFAALHSAKVMIVLGTKPEHFNAVWVKNEWSRYLALISNGANKILIPVYKDMDVYDLPGEFAYIQAQDMSKIGFMQDLLHGIEKIVKPKKIAISGSDDVFERMIASAFKNLSIGDFENAERSVNAAIGMDSTEPRAIIADLMLKNRIRIPDDLPNAKTILHTDPAFLNAIENADTKFKEELIGYSTEQRYRSACKTVEKSRNTNALKFAAAELNELTGYKDSEDYSARCANKLKKRKTIDGFIRTFVWIVVAIVLTTSFYLIFNYIPPVVKWRADNQYKNEKYEKALLLYSRIADYEDSAERITLCNNAISYNSAKVLYNAGKYEEALKAFKNSGGYKSTADQIVAKCEIELLKTAKIGDCAIFGSYEQNNKTFDGQEYIEWIILAKEDNKMLIISKYALDCQKYNTQKYNYNPSKVSVTWETCSLRVWLNETFINTAFSSKERNLIQSTVVTADKNPSFNTSSGNNTTDKVFLLSILEVNKYFSLDSVRQCQGTAYCCAYKSSNGNCWWWLRSPGYDSDLAAYVSSNGSVYDGGYHVSREGGAIRPAMWIDLS